MVLTLIYHTPAAKETHEHTLLRIAKGDIEKFGPLKAVLGEIPALIADRTVCLQSPAEGSPLRQFSGHHCRGEQGRKPHLAYNRIGGTFRFSSKRWRAGAETQRQFDTVRNCSTYPAFTPATHFLSASSTKSVNNCGHFPKSRNRLILLITSKSVKVYSSFSKTFKRQSSIIRFVCDLGHDTLFDINEDGRWRNKR